MVPAMTSQQLADELLAVYQADRRNRELIAFYEAERNAGASTLLANERMHFHAKRLDAEYERDLEIIKQCIGRKT